MTKWKEYDCYKYPTEYGMARAVEPREGFTRLPVMVRQYKRYKVRWF